METFEERLREERKRVGLNQSDAAALAGLNRTAQVRYEKGERYPDSRYLQALAEAGWDVHYILTGRRQVAVNDNENALFALYRSAAPSLQRAALTVLGAGSPELPDASKAPAFSIGGDVGQVVKTKKLNQQGISFTLNGAKAKRSKSPK